MVRTIDQIDFPDAIDNQGRWFRDENGAMWKSLVFVGGSARWCPEGYVLRGEISVRRVYYTRWERFKEWLRGGPLRPAPKGALPDEGEERR